MICLTFCSTDMHPPEFLPTNSLILPMNDRMLQVLWTAQNRPAGKTATCMLGPVLRDTSRFSRVEFCDMRVRILYHDHCFDGAASAAFFSRFLEGKFHPDARFEYTGLAHKASQLFEPGHVRRRRERHRGLQVLHRSASELVVRPSSERLPDPRGRRTFPPRYQRPENVRPQFPLLHQVHRHGGAGAIRLRCARSGGAGGVGRYRRRRAVRLAPRKRSIWPLRRRASRW